MSLFSRTNQTFFGRWWWTIDRPMLGAVGVLIIFGLVMVSTASPPVAQHHDLNDYYFLFKHLIWLSISVAAMLGLSMLSRRWVWRLASIGCVATIIALVLVLFIGDEIKGSQRWISLFGFTVQPGEFAKPAFAVVAAWLMAQHKEREKFSLLAVTACLYVLTIALLIAQPDLGMSVIVTAMWGVQIVLAGFPLRLMVPMIAAGLVLLTLAYFTLPHVQSRFDRFFFPDSGDTYQIEQSLAAFKSGGVGGAGLGQGSVKLHLPDAHTDFIFSVMGEEMGLVFVLILMGVFAFIIWRGFNRLLESEDMFTILAVGGLLAMFGLQTLVHMGSSMNILPTKGMTLPFISYGGSSLLSVSCAMGVILALTRRQKSGGVSRKGLSGHKKST
jgi:cell division protein FtsW